jgi:CRP-like cAMP-binding protein
MGRSWRCVELLGATVNAWLVPAVMVVLLAAAIWIGLRWVRSEHLDALAAIPLFHGLSRGRLLSVLGSTRKVEFSPGTAIVNEGDRGKAFYVVTKGAAAVSVSGVERTNLSAGAYFGEVAVIDGGPRSATITATTRVTTLELTPAALRRVLETEPSVASAIADELRGRLGRAGVGVEDSDAKGSDRKTLERLCRQLRDTEQADWAQTAPPHHGLRRVFARS